MMSSAVLNVDQFSPQQNTNLLLKSFVALSSASQTLLHSHGWPTVPGTSSEGPAMPTAHYSERHSRLKGEKSLHHLKIQQCMRVFTARGLEALPYDSRADMPTRKCCHDLDGPCSCVHDGRKESARSPPREKQR